MEQNVWKEWNWKYGDKVKYFKSRQQDNSHYYSNLVMLMFGMNKKLMESNSKYSLQDFVKDVK